MFNNCFRFCQHKQQDQAVTVATEINLTDGGDNDALGSLLTISFWPSLVSTNQLSMLCISKGCHMDITTNNGVKRTMA